MAYASFSFYTETYGGALIAPQHYARCAVRADAFLDALTLHRLARMETPPQEALLAACAVAEAYYRHDAAAAQAATALKSESTDGYSVTYKDAQQLAQACLSACLTAAESYLPPGHPLRYRGVGRRI